MERDLREAVGCSDGVDGDREGVDDLRGAEDLPSGDERGAEDFP